MHTEIAQVPTTARPRCPPRVPHPLWGCRSPCQQTARPGAGDSDEQFRAGCWEAPGVSFLHVAQRHPSGLEHLGEGLRVSSTLRGVTELHPFRVSPLAWQTAWHQPPGTASSWSCWASLPLTTLHEASSAAPRSSPRTAPCGAAAAPATSGTVTAAWPACCAAATALPPAPSSPWPGPSAA